jgi:hypothetical protein
MTTRSQIGHVITEVDGDELTVYLNQYAGEEPHEIQIDGRACTVSFDPSTATGRAATRTLIANLTAALTEHERACELLYSALKAGDWVVDIRVPIGDEPRCPHRAGLVDVLDFQCSRTTHDDYHHVAVDADYNVLAVRHATDRILPTGAPWLVP